MKINIVYATILGTSQMVAEELEDALSDKYEINVEDILQISPVELSVDAFYVFISSTTGHGDMPDSAYDFVNAISETKANLSKINFAIFGLGDQGYADTFNMGSEKLADVLKGAGAKQIGERGLFDASTFDMPEDIAIPWLKDILVEIPALAEVV
jgi:MioC protein